MVEFRLIEFSLELVVCEYVSMTEVAARRGSDGWKQTFDLDMLLVIEVWRKSAHVTCSNVFNIVASQSSSSSLFPQPSYLNIRASKYVFLLFI